MKTSLSSLFLSTCLGLSACATPEDGQPVIVTETPAPSPVVTAEAPSNPTTGLTQDQKFAAWKMTFIAEAIGKGYTPELVRSVVEPAKINTRALDRDATQPEFTKPVWSYVDSAASAARLNGGRAKLAEETTVFSAVEARYQVPRYILTAIWGLETSYGRIMGDHDIVSSLATFAHDGRRQKFGTTQLYAVLDMLAASDVQPEQLRGSWAGAMGMTQFIPSTFRDYAVDFDGNGNKDLWNTPADALGSAANYLSRMGWRAGEPVMTEVVVPTDFDYGLTDGTKRAVNDWTAVGVRPVSGQRWSTDAGFLEAKLIAPGGHMGPKFLTFKNFDVIRRYNNSTSYIMGISVLADGLNGKPGIRKDWPREDKALSFEDKKALQEKLTALGYSTGGIDGQIGPNTRKAIRAWQRSAGVPADGYVEQRLFSRLMTQ